MQWRETLDETFCDDDTCTENDCTNESHHVNVVVRRTDHIHNRTIVLNTNGGIRQFVTGNPNAVGYVSLSLAQEDAGGGNLPPVQGVHIDFGDKNENGEPIGAVAPTKENMFGESYRLYRPFVFISGEALNDLSQDVRGFLKYLISDEGQSELSNRGLVPVIDEKIVSVLGE
jgi:ABC-type phosphate transport system substrate-binding protein